MFSFWYLLWKGIREVQRGFILYTHTQNLLEVLTDPKKTNYMLIFKFSTTRLKTLLKTT